MTNGCEKNREKGVEKAKYGEFLKLNMGKNTILSFFPHIKEAWSSLIITAATSTFQLSLRIINFCVDYFPASGPDIHLGRVHTLLLSSH